MPSTTDALVTITSPDGRTKASVEPGSGGRLVSLVIDGVEVIATCQQPFDADYFRGSFPMAPWCGLLTDGIVHFDGAEHRVTGQSAPEGPKQYHGALHSWPFEVVVAAQHVVGMTVAIGPDQPDGWPWPGTVRQSYELRDGALVARLSAHTGGPEFPAGLGFHPWFVTSLDGERDAVVDFRPGRELVSVGGGRREAADPGEREEAVRGVGSGVFVEVDGWPTISWPDGPALELQSNAPVWVTYDGTPGGFCVEPWTTPDGRMDTPYTHRVTPDDPAVLEFVIKFRAAV